MAICHKEEARHQCLILPSYPKLHDRPRLAGAGVLGEVASILCLAGPMVGAGMLLYLRSLVFVGGRLGLLPLAGGSLALGFANITGYSVLSGLAGGMMEPVSGQVFRAGRTDLLRVALRRAVVLLLAASVPIIRLWVTVHAVLVATGQDPDIAATAYACILCFLLDLILLCFLHPLRIYLLRAQSVTLPLTYAAALFLHVPINFLLVDNLGLGIHGVALGAVFTNLNCLLFLAAYVCLVEVQRAGSGHPRPVPHVHSYMYQQPWHAQDRVGPQPMYIQLTKITCII